MVRWLLALACVLPLLAGCVSTDGNTGTAPVTPETAGAYTLTVRVTDDPGGPPLANAQVTVEWSSRRPGGTVPEVPSIAHARPVLNEDPHRPVPSGMREHALTDASGTARLVLPADTPVQLSVWAPERTTEWVPVARTGADGGNGTIEVPLYRAEVLLVFEDAWGPAAVSTHHFDGGPAEWFPTELRWGTSDEAQAGYIDRLVALGADLQWNNTPTHSGDLGIAFGEAPEANPVFLWDEYEGTYEPGAYREAFFATRWDAYEAGLNDLDALYTGPATRQMVVAPLGLPYTLAIEARFDPNPTPWHAAPGAGAVVTLALVAALAVATARGRALNRR